MCADVFVFEDQCVKRFDLCELPQIQRLVAEAGVFTSSELNDVTEMIEHYAKFCSNDELLTYVYEIGGKVVGFISFGLGMGNKTYEVYWICVSPEYQGQGIGSKLLKFAENYVSRAGCRMLFIETSSKKEYWRARDFYERMGYCSQAIVKDYFDDGDNKVIYSKRMPAT